MKFTERNLYFGILFLIVIFALSNSATAQNKASYEVLAAAALTKIVPTSFYFAGQSAATQMRNTGAARFGENHYVIAGLVDTSGYSTEISGKYEGFFITDSPIKFGGKELNTGAYGFGFSKNKINIFDLSSKLILSVSTTDDVEMKRPRPLMMTSGDKGIRLYRGKIYATISTK